MRRGSGILCLFTSVLWYCLQLLWSSTAYAQSGLPTPDQLDQLLAPVALYPDALVAQICAASTDPQQVLDADAWLQQNVNLSGQARTDAAQQRGFDPAFLALINFPQVLDMMAQHIDDYATIGRAFSANQATVMDSIQRLRQQAYAAGNLESNQYQTVDVQNQEGTQAVTIVPTSPQVVYVPVYNPQVVYAQPSPDTVVATTLLTFGAGIVLGAWIAGNSYPWGWGGWGWNWHHHTVIVHNNYWVVNNYYRAPRPYYHYRPPVYGPPIYARPPNNWHDRPYRPPAGGRPPGGGYPGKPPGGGYPGGGGPGGKPPGGGYPGGGPGGKPPGGGPGTKPPDAGSPGGGSPGTRPPGGGTPGGGRPPGNGSPGGSPNPTPQPRPGTRPAVPTPSPRPSVPASRPQPRPPAYAGYPSQTPANNTGARPSAFGGNHNASADRAAANRGRSSVAAQQQRQAPQRAPQQRAPQGGQRR